MKAELWVKGLTGLREKFESVLIASVDREGTQKVINFLRESDFYTAPASAKNHNNYKGGLVEHSLLVYENILRLSILLQSEPFDSLVLVSLLHDICKINFYKETTRNAKINGTWVQEPYYTIEDSLPIGHGEKSVIILQRLIPLTNAELMAIRWHMMGFDEAARSYGGAMALRAAADKYPLVTLLHMADLASCYLEEK
jgi:hypothetical protein